MKGRKELSAWRDRLVEKGAGDEELKQFDRAVSRRGLFRILGKGGAAVALLGFGVGGEAVLNGLFGRGLMPVAWAEEKESFPDKPDMTIHNHRPVNGEFAPHLLDDDITPPQRHFVRNNGLVPARAQTKDLSDWTLTIDGEVQNPLTLGMAELKAMPAVTYALLVECGGNGRANFDPAVRGNPWDRGAVACGRWTGVPLKELLQLAGVKDSAVYTAHYGEDTPLGAAAPFSRGIPIDKAMEKHTLVAYQLDGKDIPALNGYPVRLVVPGWIGSCSQKWLRRISLLDHVHDADKMKGYSYRNPAYPVAPGSRPPEEVMEILTSWIVKSMITRPAADSRFEPGATVLVRGHAWAGEDEVDKVLVSMDYGVHWQKTKLRRPPNKYAWYTWETDIKFPNKGYYEIWARAFDDKGNSQPFRQPWNPKGYLGNVIHRVPVFVGI